MSTLGLSGPPTPQDSLFKRLFWPSIGNAADADLLGQQGFWICFAIAVFAFLGNSIRGHWAIGLLALVFFFLGGVGVREHDVFAAVAVSIAYWVDIVATIAAGRYPGVFPLIGAALLTANIRGCRVATRSIEAEGLEAFPLRFGESWRDKLVDQMPAKFWPRLKGVFLVTAAAYLLLIAAGVTILFIKGRHALPG